jgi:hypothetical protein
VSRVDRWFFKQQQRNDRFVSIQDLFFSEKQLNYFFYRLRILNLQVLFRYVFFCLILSVLYQQVSFKSFTIVFYASIFKTLISKFWWGALERFRARVRHAYYAHMSRDIDKLIGVYLAFSLLIACIFFFTSNIALYYFNKENYIDYSTKLYLFYLTIIVSLYFLLRTYHSGVYAITRIIRTPISVIGPDLIGILMLFLTLYTYPLYSWIIAVMTRTSISYLLTWHYSSRMYQFYKIEPEYPSKSGLKKFLGSEPGFKQMCLSGLAFMLIQSDIVLLPILLNMLQNQLITNQDFLMIYLALPMFVASGSWAFLFYFDRKRIRGTDFAKMMIFYNDTIIRLSPIMAVLFWLMAFCASTIFFSNHYVWPMISALPFFILKAKLSDGLIKRYSYQGYWDVLILYTGLIILLTLAYIIFSFTFATYVLGMLGYILAIRFIKKPLFSPSPNKGLYKIPVGYFNFLIKLGRACQKPLTVYRVHALEDINLNQTYALLDSISKEFVGPDGEVCFFDDHIFLFFTRNQSLHRNDIIKKCYGLLRHISRIDLSSQEDYIAESKNPNGFFTHLFPPEIFSMNAIPDTTAMLNLFRNKLPHGIIFHPQPELCRLAKPMSQYEVRSVYVSVMQYLYHTRNKHPSSYDFSCIYLGGRVEYIFAIPQNKHSKQQVEEWQKAVSIFNIFQATRLVKDIPDTNDVLAK